MYSDKNQRRILLAMIVGTVISLIACILFGILDVQCLNSTTGKFWNAHTQRCQLNEVPESTIK